MKPKTRRSPTEPEHRQPPTTAGAHYAASYSRSAIPNAAGIEEQHRANQRRAEEHGLVLPDDPKFRFTDDGVSGVAHRRRGFDRLLQTIKQGHAPFERIYVRDAARLGRWSDVRMHAYYEGLFQEHGVQLRYTDHEAWTDETADHDHAR